MPRYTTRLIDRWEVAYGTMAFALERPEGFAFKAGQYLTLTLPDPLYTDAKGNSRTFSIASPPEEASHLLVATRMTGSALKRSLAEAELGTPVSIFGPAGSFVLPDAPDRPPVLIAGGIGVTPFRSIVLDGKGQKRRMKLVYSNRSPEVAAFHGEFAGVATTEFWFSYLPTMTHTEGSVFRWGGETRMISAELLSECLGDLGQYDFYLAGPPGMVAAGVEAVRAGGARPAQIFTEEFSGYEKPAAAAPAVEAAQPGAVRVAAVGELPPGKVRVVEAGGRRIAVFNVGGAYYAIGDECPHAGASLSEGDVEGTRVICPMHGAAFDLTTGAVVEPPADESVPCYGVAIRNGQVFLEL